MSLAIVPMGFALVGGLTGATANAFPPEVIDWTSADVIDFARPTSLRAHPGAIGLVEIAPPVPERPVKRYLDEIKRKSRVTWQQIADAMGVDARAIHLWKSGGGISAAHEERLQELSALVDSIDTGTPTDVRAELLEVTPLGSLLDRLRAGDSPRELQALAPWRSRALEDLERNLTEWENNDILDEDFVFLLYLQPAQVATFAAEARELVGMPGAVRRDWETVLDAQFAAMQQPEPVAVGVAEDDAPAEDDYGIAPLFKPDDLGIPLGVGAIASRPPLHEAR
jgi:hypothetical protein